MAWLIRKYNLRARLCISIHDEVRYLCDQRCADQVALALQVSDLITLLGIISTSVNISCLLQDW